MRTVPVQPNGGDGRFHFGVAGGSLVCDEAGLLYLAAADLHVGDEILVLTWLHQGNRGTLSVHPRDDLSLPLTGVFSTRSSDRPNPLGLHRVTIISVEGNAITVRDLEAIDGTPVLDVKPVLSAGYDR